MGCWGYDPMSCDGPHDIYQIALGKPANKLLEKYFGKQAKYQDSHEKWEALGVIQLIINAELPIDSEEHVKKAIKLAWECLRDEEFVGDFKNQKEMKKATNAFLEDLYEMVEIE